MDGDDALCSRAAATANETPAADRIGGKKGRRVKIEENSLADGRTTGYKCCVVKLHWLLEIATAEPQVR